MKNPGRFLLASILAITAAARGEANDFTLFGGVHHPGRFTLNSAVQEGVNLARRPSDFGVFGIRTSRGTVLGTEQTIAFAPNFLESASKAFLFNTNAIVQVPAAAVRPYLTGGLGVVHAFGNGPGDIGTKFALNYGGGLRIGGPAAVRLDARGYTLPGVQSQTLNVLEVSLGVVFSY
jgi:hypothetical protein